MENNENPFLTDESFQVVEQTFSPGSTTPTHTCLTDALDTIQSRARGSRLSEVFWAECAAPLRYVEERTGLSRNEAVIVAILCEFGCAISWRRLGEFLGLSRLRAMTLNDDVESLKRRRWVIRAGAHEDSSCYDGFRLVYGVVTAMRNNTVFTPPKIEGLSQTRLLERLFRISNKNGAPFNELPYGETLTQMMDVIDANPQHEFCIRVQRLEEELAMYVLLLLAIDYLKVGQTPDEGLGLDFFEERIDSEWEFEQLSSELADGSHKLFREGLIEHACIDGMVDPHIYRLSDYVRDTLLGDVEPQKAVPPTVANRDLKGADSIREKKMYYNPSEASQVERLRNLLSDEGLKGVQKRLAEMGMRTGVACLFYGVPGTGKTETVLQLARLTGRDVFQVKISEIRDKYVGETEKQIKSVFDRYRRICRRSKKAPILFFNEADALIGNRFETVKSSVEKMDNAMQNILLQEMETLEGILIATTNLTTNLDRAFDRRFLFKVEFRTPEPEVSAQIWHSILPDLDLELCRSLTKEFTFSGGQIENIARKYQIEYILSGRRPSPAEIRGFCREEYLDRANRPRIGF